MDAAKGKEHGTEREFCSQMYFSVNDNVVAWKYIYPIRSSAVRWFQKVNSCLKMCEVRLKHVAVNVIWMLFKLKRDCEHL
jgi:hypothetical protein